MKRTIKDLDSDLSQMKASVENINGALVDIVKALNKEPEKPKKSAAQVAHDVEFPKAKKTEAEDVVVVEPHRMPSFELTPNVGQWVCDVAKYHKRTVEQELQLMIKKMYYSSKAAMEAEASRVAGQ